VGRELSRGFRCGQSVGGTEKPVLVHWSKESLDELFGLERMGIVEYSDVARRLIEPSVASKPDNTDVFAGKGEIDWGMVPGHHAMADKFAIDEFAATVTSCNAIHPAGEKARTESLDNFLSRVDYAAMESRARDFMKSIGRSSQMVAAQMIGPHGKDAREWSQERCDDFARDTPFERLNANKGQGN